MNIEEAKNYIINHATDILEPDNSSRNMSNPKGYVCPICGSGSHSPNGTGITTKDGIHFTCWGQGQCFTNADIIDILALKDGYQEQGFINKLKHACKRFNITLEEQRTTPLDPVTETPIRAQTPQKRDIEEDYSEEIYTALQCIDECDYLDKRGISKDLQKRMRIGFDPHWKNPNDHKAAAIPALIIPTYGNSAYTARDLRDTIGKGDRYRKAGQPHLYNTFALYSDSDPVFVVEGEIDALSIMELGFKAIAIGAVKYTKLLIEEIQDAGALKPNIPLLILALDNDNAGANATNYLCKELQTLGASYHLPKSSEIYGECKDANECLVNERDLFRQRLANLNKSKEELYNETSAQYQLDDFMRTLREHRNPKPISTGFNNLNGLLDGGLFAGLYCIGAISSLGKTTFTLQLADAIAQSGQDVLIFSLEMSRKELIAKSISRLTFKGMKAGQQTDKMARSTRDLISNVNKNTTEQMGIIANAVEAYRAYANNIFIVEGLGDVNIERIRDTVANHVVCRNKTPVVVIDYLQIIAPHDERATDKQNTDRAVLELKRISRDFNTPVLAISSLNRQNYTETITMQAFKESGAIEYSSDVLIGLQLAGAGSKGFDVEEAKAKQPREIELKILKNRNGITGRGIEFLYYSRYNTFVEC